MPYGLDTTKQVFFYEQEFYFLSNFSAFNIEMNGIKFATSEHAYHWHRFNHGYPCSRPREIQEYILSSKSAYDAFQIAQDFKKEWQRKDWDEIKIFIMLTILYNKVNQHEYIQRKLLETGSRELIENSWRDSFWGWGESKDGKNILGKLWMQVRNSLIEAKENIL